MSATVNYTIKLFKENPKYFTNSVWYCTYSRAMLKLKIALYVLEYHKNFCKKESVVAATFQIISKIDYRKLQQLLKFNNVDRKIVF